MTQLLCCCVVCESGPDADADVSRSESRRLSIFQEDVTAQKIKDAISCQCDDGTLTVTVDRHILQVTQASFLRLLCITLRT